MNVSRKTFDALLPEGSIWNIKQDSDLDKLLDGMSLNAEEVAIFLAKLADLRNPYKTLILNDLEREFGISYNANLSEDTRRKALASAMFTRGLTGSLDNMKDALIKAGFTNFSIYQNDPAIDPAIVHPTLIVNGDLFFAGSLVTYIMPTDPKYFPFIFFLGGTATRDINGYITSIEYVQIDRNRKNELKKLILKYKPEFTWGGSKIILSNFNFFNFVSYTNLTTPIVSKGFSTYNAFNYGEELKYSDFF